IRKGDGRNRIRRREAKSVLERIVVADAGGAAPVFEGTVINAVAAAHHEFRSYLISKAEARRKIGFLYDTQPGAVGIGIHKIDAVFGEQAGEAGRQRRVIFPTRRNNVLRTGEWRAGNEIGLRAVAVAGRAEPIPAQAEIQREFTGNFPIVLKVSAVIGFLGS